MNQAKVKGSTASIVEFIFGGLFLLIGLAAVANPRMWGGSPLSLVFLFLGAFWVVSAIEWRMLIKDYRTYMALLAADPSGSISRLAQATNTAEKTVKENLRLMIKKKMTEGVALNEQENIIVTPMSRPAAPQAGTAVIAGSAPKKMIVSCPGCGAANEVVEGKAASCEHCGAAISS